MSSLKNNASNLFRVITEIEDKSNFVLIEQICWKKKNGTPSKEARLTRVWENVFIFIRKSDWKSFHQKYKNILVGKPNYIEAPNNDFANDINKACFSSSMVEQLLTLYGANENSLVLDNFMGTGTTSIGCEKIGCSSIGIELDKATFDFSKERIKEYIGDFGALKEENIFNIELL
jgi:site-specific DNA-methyltransferase (adenine-specific)